MLRGLARTPTGVPGRPTCAPDEPIGFDTASGFGFGHESEKQAGRDFGSQTFAMQTMSGQPSLEDSSPEFEHGGGGFPWHNGAPQFYEQDAFHTSHQSNAQNAVYERNTTIISSNYSWDGSGEYPDRTYVTSPSAHDPIFTTPFEEQQLLPLRYSISNSTSNTDYTDVSQNQDIFDPSSPSTPTSSSAKCDTSQCFSSLPIPTLSSNEPNPQPARKLSTISSTESETPDDISCSNCSTNNTSLWRRTHDGRQVCNACGLFLRLHGIPRPLSLKTDVVKKRRRERASGTITTGKSGTRTRASRNLTKAPSILENKRG